MPAPWVRTSWSAHSAPERLAAGGQLADEVLQPPVVGVAAGLGAHDADAHLGEEVPVGVEVARGGVEELEAGEVRRAAAVADDGGVEGAAERVGGEQVLARVADEGDAVGDRVQRPLQAGPRRRLARRRRRGRPEVGMPSAARARSKQVGALGVVELQRARQRVEDAGGGAGDLAALEAGVVLDAQPGQRGDLAAAQARHAAAAGGREAGLVRGDAGAASGEELAHLLRLSMPSSLGRTGGGPSREGCPVSTPLVRDSLRRPARAFTRRRGADPAPVRGTNDVEQKERTRCVR